MMFIRAYALGALLLIGTAALNASEPFTGELEIVLRNGLFRESPNDQTRQNLIMHLEAEQGRWREIWGQALSFNQEIHQGYVSSFNIAPERIDLQLVMEIGRDKWVASGKATYALKLEKIDIDKFKGTYSGTFRDQPLEGRVEARIKPRRIVKPDYKPLEPNEHPRMLFRRHELNALRDRAQLPIGQAYLKHAETSGDLVSLGMLYQLTGKRNTPKKHRKSSKASKVN